MCFFQFNTQLNLHVFISLETLLQCFQKIAMRKRTLFNSNLPYQTQNSAQKPCPKTLPENLTPKMHPETRTRSNFYFGFWQNCRQAI